MSEQLALLPTYAVHCFFACGHVVREGTPFMAHGEMAAHYREKHAAPVAAIVGSLR